MSAAIGVLEHSYSQPDVLHLTRHPRDRDHVSDPELVLEQNEEPGNHILNQSLSAKAKSYSQRGSNSDKRGYWQSPHAGKNRQQGDDDDCDQEGPAQHRPKSQRAIATFALAFDESESQSSQEEIAKEKEAGDDGAGDDLIEPLLHGQRG